MMQGCWSYGTQAVCNGISGCSWETSSGDGWCEEVMCWTYDSRKGGNESYCSNSSLVKGLNCAWFNDSFANDGTGWCEHKHH